MLGNEEIVVCFKAISYHLCPGTEGNHEYHREGRPVSRESMPEASEYEVVTA